VLEEVPSAPGRKMGAHGKSFLPARKKTYGARDYRNPLPGSWNYFETRADAGKWQFPNLVWLRLRTESHIRFRCYVRIQLIRVNYFDSVALQPLREIHQLDLMLDTHVRNRHLDYIEPLRDPSDPLVPADRGEPLGHGPSYSVAAVTSTVCETPSMSWIVTRQERTGTGAR
jgi:hypothetical protein